MEPNEQVFEIKKIFTKTKPMLNRFLSYMPETCFVFMKACFKKIGNHKKSSYHSLMMSPKHKTLRMFPLMFPTELQYFQYNNIYN